ncbi:hypothetical protein ABZ801_33295 [Actinomadura sp. NPDC047616]|uniref:hypothetical protein n=1 Tax=Actinomadura sp. NPDC047616 TaxID=3155914 RepID=UPI0033E5D6EC
MAIDIKDIAHAVNAARPWVLPQGGTHGEDTLLNLRNELFRQIVGQEGCRSSMTGLVVDDRVASGTGTLDEVMERGFSLGVTCRRRLRSRRAAETARGPAERTAGKLDWSRR